MVPDGNLRRHRPHTTAAVLRPEFLVRRVPIVEIADDLNLPRGRGDEYELHLPSRERLTPAPLRGRVGAKVAGPYPWPRPCATRHANLVSDREGDGDEQHRGDSGKEWADGDRARPQRARPPAEAMTRKLTHRGHDFVVEALVESHGLPQLCRDSFDPVFRCASHHSPR